jgi:replicative DNA helicase
MKGLIIMCIKVEDLKKLNLHQARNYFKELIEQIKNSDDNLIILNGKANTGKTTIATKLAEYFSTKELLQTLFFSLETSKATIKEMVKDYTDYLVIYDKPITIENMIYKIKEEDSKFVVVDYIQLIGFDKSKCLSRDKELELIKQELKDLADKLNIKIVVTSYQK